MIIPDATSQTCQLDVRTRSLYSFQSLTRRVGRRESCESFVMGHTIRKAGLLTEPFWETVGDLEGESYREYIERYPDFDLAVRTGVYDRLVAAQRLLPADWQLVIKAGFRPLAVQQRILKAFQQKSRRDHPDWDAVRHLEHARTFVTDPDLVCPPHCTGGAVDIDVRHRTTGQLVDMGCPVNTDTERAFLFSVELTDTQRADRMTLLDAMLAVGFSPNPHEWWHYQYGETFWAAFYGESMTVYDALSM